MFPFEVVMNECQGFSVLQLLMSYRDTDPHQAFLSGYVLVAGLHQNVLHNVFIVGVALAE